MNRKLILLGLTLLALSVGVRPLEHSQNDALNAVSQSLQGVIKTVAPTIVSLDVIAYVRPDEADNSSTVPASDRQRLAKSHNIGSGVIVDPDGYIVTNAHVVEGARLIRVTLNEILREKYSHRVGELSSITFDARLVGSFEEADLALLKIDAVHLPKINFADSDMALPGQLVFAVGTPEGFSNSVSMGVVSAVGRDSGNEGATYIQTDAAINPGSSGGALFDTNGSLLGITSFVVTDRGSNAGLGFALPSNLVRSIISELKNSGHVSYGELGLRIQQVTITLARGLHLAQEWGVIVSDVVPGSSADKGGIKVQDVVVASNGQRTTSVPLFAMSLYGRRPGDLMNLEILRGTHRLQVSVRLGDRPNDSDSPPDAATVQSGLVPKLGVVCTPLSQSSLGAVGVRSTSGLVVIAKLMGPDTTELTPGDVIRSINDVAVSNVEALRSELGKLRSGSSAVLQIERQRHFQYLSLEIE